MFRKNRLIQKLLQQDNLSAEFPRFDAPGPCQSRSPADNRTGYEPSSRRTFRRSWESWSCLQVRAIISKLPAPAPDISIFVQNQRQPKAGLTELLIEGATKFQAVPKVRDDLA